MAQLPPFNEGNIKNWFIQIEAIFNVRRITGQRVKYGHIASVLPPPIVEVVSDLLETVPEHDPYTVLKETILKRTGRSEEALIRELFSNITRDDRTPTQLLRFMRSRLGKNVMAEPILKNMWIDRLPPTVTQILAPMSEDTPLDQLAEAADRIYDKLDSHTLPVHSADGPTDCNPLEKAVEELQRQVRELTLALSRQHRGRTQPYRRDKSKQRSSSRVTKPRSAFPTSTFCYYHQRYGPSAHRCKKPCNYTTVSGNGMTSK